MSIKSSYNYTLVERHKQKIYIPYVGFEFSGWSVVIGMILGVLIGLPILGFPLSLIFGDFGFVIAVALTVLLEVITVTFATEIDRESGKNRLLTFFYTSIKKYRIVYDMHGNRHYLSKRKEGVIHYVCGENIHIWRRKHRLT